MADSPEFHPILAARTPAQNLLDAMQQAAEQTNAQVEVAQQAATASGQARDASVVAKGQSETARDGSVTAKGQAEAARDGSVTAKGQAEAARDGSVTAKGQAEAARDVILAQEDTLQFTTRAGLKTYPHVDAPTKRRWAYVSGDTSIHLYIPVRNGQNQIIAGTWLDLAEIFGGGGSGGNGTIGGISGLREALNERVVFAGENPDESYSFDTYEQGTIYIPSLSLLEDYATLQALSAMELQFGYDLSQEVQDRQNGTLALELVDAGLDSRLDSLEGRVDTLEDAPSGAVGNTSSVFSGGDQNFARLGPNPHIFHGWTRVLAMEGAGSNPLDFQFPRAPSKPVIVSNTYDEATGVAVVNFSHILGMNDGHILLYKTSEGIAGSPTDPGDPADYDAPVVIPYPALGGSQIRQISFNLPSANLPWTYRLAFRPKKLNPTDTDQQWGAITSALSDAVELSGGTGETAPVVTADGPGSIVRTTGGIFTATIGAGSPVLVEDWLIQFMDAEAEEVAGVTLNIQFSNGNRDVSVTIPAMLGSGENFYVTFDYDDGDNPGTTDSVTFDVTEPAVPGELVPATDALIDVWAIPADEGATPGLTNHGSLGGLVAMQGGDAVIDEDGLIGFATGRYAKYGGDTFAYDVGKDANYDFSSMYIKFVSDESGFDSVLAAVGGLTQAGNSFRIGSHVNATFRAGTAYGTGLEHAQAHPAGTKAELFLTIVGTESALNAHLEFYLRLEGETDWTLIATGGDLGGGENNVNNGPFTINTIQADGAGSAYARKYQRVTYWRKKADNTAVLVTEVDNLLAGN